MAEVSQVISASYGTREFTKDNEYPISRRFILTMFTDNVGGALNRPLPQRNVASFWQRARREVCPSGSCSWWSKIKASSVKLCRQTGSAYGERWRDVLTVCSRS